MSASQINLVSAVAVACAIAATLVGCAATGLPTPTRTSVATPTAAPTTEGFELGIDVAGALYATQWCAVDAAQRSLAEKVADSVEPSLIDRDVTSLRASLINLASAATTESYVWPSSAQKQIAIVGDWALAEAARGVESGVDLTSIGVPSSQVKAADGAIRDITTLPRDHDLDCTFLGGQ